MTSHNANPGVGDSGVRQIVRRSGQNAAGLLPQTHPLAQGRADPRVKWLSLEPLLAPLEFTDLSMFDWVVIGSQSATEQPKDIAETGYVPEFAPPFEWVSRIVAQAREAGCKVYLKPNLLGAKPNPQCPGMQLPQEEPDIPAEAAE
jgi:hypothetical protein